MFTILNGSCPGMLPRHFCIASRLLIVCLVEAALGQGVLYWDHVKKLVMYGYKGPYNESLGTVLAPGIWTV